MTLYTEIKNDGQWEPTSAADCEAKWRVMAYLDRLRDGSVIETSIRRIYPEKTSRQLATHWGLLIDTTWRHLQENGIDLATFLGSDTIPPGIIVSRRVVHEVLTAVCGHVDERGRQKRLSAMNTAEVARFFDYGRNWLAGRFEIIVPDPLPAHMRKSP